MTLLRRHQIIRLVVFNLLYLICQFSFSQTEDKTQSKAELILKIAKEFKWDKSDNSDPIRIVTLGDLKLSNALYDLSSDLIINERSIEVIYLDEIVSYNKKINVVYCNKNSGFSESEVSSLVKKNKSLFVGENFNFNYCMVSIAETTEDFILGLNRSKLKKAGFSIPLKLKRKAIHSAVKWYNTKKREGNKLEGDLSTDYTAEDTSGNEGLEIFYFVERIKKLESTIKDKESSLEHKVAELDSMTGQIEDQLVKDGVQKTTIFTHEQTIENQANEIEIRDKTIFQQKQITILLIAVVILIILISILLLRSNYIKKRNVSILAEKNKEIQNQSEEIEQLVYIASHDLQTPVDTIYGFTDLLEHQLASKLSANDLTNIKFIKDSSNRMSLLIKDLLEYSKISQKKTSEKFYLEDLIMAVSNDLQSKLNQQNATVYIEGDENLMIIARKTEIRLLFQNLIENAIKFRKEEINPEIIIKFQHLISNTDETITICSVADNGIGIDKEHRESIFEIFNRLHLEEEYSGTGIGLAHCKKIIQRHNGKIWVDPDHKPGSKFNFTIHNQRISTE